MTKLVSTLVLMVFGLIVLATAAPYLVRLADALVPLVVIVGAVIVVVRIAWHYTGDRW